MHVWYTVAASPLLIYSQILINILWHAVALLLLLSISHPEAIVDCLTPILPFCFAASQEHRNFLWPMIAARFFRPPVLLLLQNSGILFYLISIINLYNCTYWWLSYLISNYPFVNVIKLHLFIALHYLALFNHCSFILISRLLQDSVLSIKYKNRDIEILCKLF